MKEVFTMTRDPICGMRVDPDKSKFSSTFDGHQFYFCNEACKMTFDANPSSYSKYNKKKSAVARFLDWITKGNEKAYHGHPPNCCGH